MAPQTTSINVTMGNDKWGAPVFDRPTAANHSSLKKCGSKVEQRSDGALQRTKVSANPAVKDRKQPAAERVQQETDNVTLNPRVQATAFVCISQ